MNEEEFESLVVVDKYNLDREAAEQPRLFWQYSRLIVKAQEQLDYLEADLKVTDSELDEDIRDNPKMYGLEVSSRTGQVTETNIRNAILRSKEHRQITKSIIKKRAEVNLLISAKETLDQRRTSISNLVRLSEQNYFSRPAKRTKEDRSRFRSKKKE